eukprot:GEZU01013465.1.p1 GENE.GEZU01013465.1~~GEZU01013465.1.p1  ORF type:complete len:205 (-),score=52.54 GEZU01013465.1:81-695(-)
MELKSYSSSSVVSSATRADHHNHYHNFQQPQQHQHHHQYEETPTLEDCNSSDSDSNSGSDNTISSDSPVGEEDHFNDVILAQSSADELVDINNFLTENIVPAAPSVNNEVVTSVLEPRIPVPVVPTSRPSGVSSYHPVASTTTVVNIAPSIATNVAGLASFTNKKPTSTKKATKTTCTTTTTTTTKKAKKVSFDAEIDHACENV